MMFYFYDNKYIFSLLFFVMLDPGPEIQDWNKNLDSGSRIISAKLFNPLFQSHCIGILLKTEQDLGTNESGSKRYWDVGLGFYDKNQLLSSFTNLKMRL
jgi:hypothetical protein